MAKNEWGDELVSGGGGTDWGDEPVSDANVPADSGGDFSRSGPVTDTGDESSRLAARYPAPPAPGLADARANEAAQSARFVRNEPVPQAPTEKPVSVLQTVGMDQSKPWSFAEASRARRAIEDAPQRRPEASISETPLATQIGMDARKSVTNPAARGVMAGLAGLGQVIPGAVQAGADLVGADGLSSAAGRVARAGQQVSAPMAPAGGTDKLVFDIANSITQTAPTLIVGLGGGPAMTALFGQSAAQEYTQGRSAGLDGGTAAARAGVMAGAEVLGERFGFGEQITILKGLAGRVPVDELAQVFARQIMKEIPGEQLTTLIQFLGDKYGPGAQNPEAALADYLTQAGETLKVTIGQTAVMGGGPVVMNKVREGLAKPIDRKPQIEALRKAGDETAAALVEKRQQKEQSAYSTERETQALAQINPELAQRYRDVRMAGAKTGDAVVQTAARWNFEQAAQMAGLSPKAQEVIAAKLADIPPEKAATFVQKAIAGLVNAGQAQPFDGMDTLAQTIETQRDQMLDSVLATMNDIETLEQQDAQDPAQAATEAADAVPAAAVPDGADAVSGGNEPGSVPALSDLNDVMVTPELDAVHAAATSPLNDLPEPTDAQKKAGNYKVGKIRMSGMDISIENPQGSERRGVDADGKEWSTPMRDHYGYFKGTTAADGDKLDVFIKPGTPQDYNGMAFVVDQIDPKTGKFDEHKVVFGAADQAEAEAIYRRNYSADWKGMANITALPMPAFKAWAASKATRKPLGAITEQTNVQDAAPGTEAKAAAAPVEAAPAGSAAAPAGVPAAPGAGDVQADGLALLGQNSQPLSEGGKPFKTELAARKEKKLHPDKRVVKSPDGKGFILKPMSAKQIAAQEAAARRIKGADTGEKGPLSAHGFILARGGLAKSSMADAGFDKNVRIGNRWLFTDSGKTLAQAGQSLKEAGFITEETENAASDIIRRSIASPQYTSEGWDAVAEAEAQTRFEDHLKAQQESEDDPFATLTDHGYTEEDTAGTGYDQASPEIQAEVAALSSQLESMGEDSESIRERVALQYPDATQQEYHEHVKDAITAAIAEAAQPAGRGDPGQDDGEQGQAREGTGEILTAEAAIRAAVEAVPNRTIGSWYPVTVTHNGRTQDFLSNIKRVISDGKGPQAIHLKQIKDGKLVASDPARPLVYFYKLSRTDELAEEGIPRYADDADLKQWSGAFGTTESLTDRPDGTLSVKGDTAVIKERLTTAGIPAKSILPSATGVVVGRTQAAKAREVLTQTLTAPTKADIEAQQERVSRADELDSRAQVKSESEAGADSFMLTREDGRNGGTQPMFQAIDPTQIFYSELARQIEKSPMNAGAPAAWVQYLDALAKRGAIKADEVEWTGLREWLNLQTGKVTKAQIAEFLDANGIQVTETVLGGESNFVDEDTGEEYPTSNNENPPKYQNYTLPGGENYREVLLTLPSKDAEFDPVKVEIKRHRTSTTQGSFNIIYAGKDVGRFSDTIEYKDGAYVGKSDEQIIEIMRKRFNGSLTLGIAPQHTGYRSSHWDQPNVLAHIRVNDRTDANGKRVLFVEELQSDWGQDGKKRGFRKVLSKAQKTRVAELDSITESRDFTPQEQAEYDSMRDGFSNDAGVALAPFVDKTDKWLALSLKRIMKMAVDGGYDRVAFVNGEQSAERYDLSKQVSRLAYDSEGTLEVFDMRGDNMMTRKASEDELSDLIGKETALRLIDAPRTPGGRRSLEGDGLNVGGEGMKSFYNAIVPNAVKDVLKKVGGGKLEAVKFGIESDQYSNAARYEGQARTADEVQALYDVAKKSGGDIYDNPLTGRRETFAINRVANEDALKRVLRSLNQGQTFEQAMLNPDIASPSFAELLGGRYVEIPKSQRKQDVLSQPGFTITDSMRENVAGGLPLFAVDGGAKAGDTSTDGQPDTRPEARINIGLLGRDIAAYLGESRAKFDEVHPYVGRRIPQGEALGEIAQAFNAEIQGFGLRPGLTPTQEKHYGFFGGVRTSGVVFLRTEGNDRPHLAVLGHELAHELASKRPDLYKQLVQAINPYVNTAKYRAEFVNSVVAKNVESAHKKTEEFIGEVLSDGFMDPDFWRALGRKNPSLLQQVGDFVFDMIEKAMKALGYTKRSVPYLTDFKAVMRIAGEVMAEYGVAPRGGRGDLAFQTLGDGKAERAPASVNADRALDRQAEMFQPGFWDVPQEKKLFGYDLDKVVYELQDGRIDLKRVQEAITKANVIPEKFDARLQETLYPGRVATRSERFLTDEARPLLDAMARNNVTMDELADFLHARHAEERNKQIAKVNVDLPDGGAGKNSKGVLMTTEAAKAHIAALSEGKRMVLSAMAKRVDTITQGTTKLLVDEGLEKQETIDAWTGAYKSYVPLFRDEAENGNPHPSGSGMSVRGSSSKRAVGSTKKATNILAHVLMQREAAITRAEKNRVAVALYGLALTNPNPDFWTTIKPSMSPKAIGQELQRMGVDPTIAEAGMMGVPTIKSVDPTLGRVVSRPNPMYKSLPGAIVLKVNGEDRVLMVNTNDPRGLRMAENLKNLDGLTKFDIAGSIVGKATRWMASVNTQYNPAFGLVNLTRDTLGGAINLSSTKLRGKTMKVLALTPGALKGIGMELSGKKSGEWGRLFRQFQADGGQTGFREQFKDANDRAKALESELKALEKAGKLSATKVAGKMLDALDIFNTTLENAVRLAAYREALQEGMSRPEAARLGRELTVDFNRKGRMGRELGPLYAFFNASVQGTARTMQTLAGPAGAEIIAGGVTLGVLQAIMLLAAGYDEDEVPEFVKSRALVIPLGTDEEGKKRYFTLPLPLGLHVLPNTGRVLTELTLDGGKDSLSKGFAAMGEIAGAFNPLGGGNIFTGSGALRTVAPTVVDPIVETMSNENFAGSPIEREKMQNDPRPGFQRAREGTLRTPTGQTYTEISRIINTMTGGDEYEAGKASPSPEMVRYWAQVVGGGLLREVEKIVNTSIAMANGDDTKPTGYPVFGRFYGEVDDESVQKSRYYDNLAAIEKAEKMVKAAEKAGDLDSAQRIEEAKPEALLNKEKNRAQKDLRDLNREAMETVGDRQAIKAIDAERTEVMRELNSYAMDIDKPRRDGSLGGQLKKALGLADVNP